MTAVMLRVLCPKFELGETQFLVEKVGKTALQSGGPLRLSRDVACRLVNEAVQKCAPTDDLGGQHQEPAVVIWFAGQEAKSTDLSERDASQHHQQHSFCRTTTGAWKAWLHLLVHNLPGRIQHLQQVQIERNSPFLLCLAVAYMSANTSGVRYYSTHPGASCSYSLF